MEKYQKQAAENRPYGHIRVRSGRILPGDLVWSLYTHEWLRHDHPSWDQTCEWVWQACYVIRPGIEPKAKPPEIVDPERLPETDHGPQLSLF